MSTPFLAEMRIFSFNFAPKGWAMCNGQILPIQQNAALFSLLGTTYGGNGINTFALPNFQSRIPVHAGQGPGLSPYVLGQIAGVESVTLNTAQMPQHNHFAQAFNGAANQAPITGHAWAQNGANQYKNASGSIMNAACIPTMGGNQPHTNLKPFLVLNFCIALQGIFPSRN